MHKKRLLPLCIALAAASQLQAQTAETTDETQVDEVTVTGVRAAELNAREEERSKNIFSSVISQDDAGNFADQNVAESLQRLPGITLQKSEGEGKFVSVRGLGPGFVTVQQNGAELATAGSDDRSFALDAIPSDLLSSIEVFKSLTPDMDLNSIGGVVNVKTVSAFDRQKDSLRLNVQDYYQDYRGEHSPKLSVQGTNLFLDDTIGVGYSASWEERKTVTYEMLHHETTDPRYVQKDLLNTTPDVEDLSSYMLIPFEYQNRQEVADRERSALSLDLGYQPNDDTEYYVRGTYTEYTDMDVAWREYYRFGQAGADDIAYIDRASNTFGVVDADIQQQMFIQDGTSKTSSYALGGKNDFGVDDGEYQLDYEYSWSKSTYEKPDGQRVQFRERDVPLIARADKEYIVAQAISPNDLAALMGTTVSGAGFVPDQISGYSAQGVSLGGFEFDNLFLENSSRSDELDAIQVNLKREFDDSWFNYWKVGFNIKNRVRDRNQDRWSLVPKDFSPQCAGAPDVAQCRYDIQSNLTDHEYAMLEQEDFVYPAITKRGAEQLISSVRAIANQDTQQGLESVFRDYTMTEDTAAAYVMGEFQLSDNQSLIAGVRWEQTEFSSNGYFAINNDAFDIGSGNTVSFDYSIPLEAEVNKYHDLYPSIHYRFEPREDLLIRSSLWTSFTRPSFDQSRAYATIASDFQLCNPVTGVCSSTPDSPNLTAEDLASYTLGPDSAMEVGNPSLEPMNSINLDASIGWYADSNQFLQAAVFYKDIKDFIVSVQGSQVALNDLPMQLPVEGVTGFIIPPDLVMNNVNWTTNGDKAQVYGIELTYVYNFTAGYFFQTNATFMNSTAEAGDSIRVGDIQLPEQADVTGNATIGWEKDEYSVRLIGNYTSEILKRIGSCPAGSEGRLISTPSNAGTTCKVWADQYLGDTFSMDFKATYQITDDLKVYFDAMNITDEYSTTYYDGNEYSNGKMMYHSEVYGRSYQIGLNYKFM
ncbi:MAG TPA: TonB-dependent receptor [Cellvibrio sp.]|nr:TonB-dependent receptor [Cellvibrio sp.]